VHLVDADNNIIGIYIEPTTALIRVTDQRIDPPKPRTIPDRIRPLLQPTTAGKPLSLPSSVPK
jgi:hypothetical protein